MHCPDYILYFSEIFYHQEILPPVKTYFYYYYYYVKMKHNRAFPLALRNKAIPSSIPQTETSYSAVPARISFSLQAGWFSRGVSGLESDDDVKVKRHLFTCILTDHWYLPAFQTIS